MDILRSNLSIVRKFNDLPERVRRALDPAFQQHVNPRCADCLGRGLIFAGVSSDGCFVYYRAVGIATSYEIVVFDKKAEPIWAARGIHAGDVEELRSFIAGRKFYSFPVEHLVHH